MSATGRADRRLDRQRRPAERRHRLGRRAGTESRLAVRPCARPAPRSHHAPLVAGAGSGGRPAADRCEQAVDRDAVVIAGRETVERDGAAAEAVAGSGEAVGPRVQQRDAHRRAAPGIGAESVAQAEQLLAAMAQRAGHHPERGGERHAQVVRRARRGCGRGALRAARRRSSGASRSRWGSCASVHWWRAALQPAPGRGGRYGSRRSSRNARSSASRVASSGGGSGVSWSDPTSLRMSSR